MLERLYEEYRPALIRYLRRLTGDVDVAEDLAQEAFARLLNESSVPERPRPWLFTVATNLVRDDARARTRQRGLLEHAVPELVRDPPPGPAEEAERRRRALAVRAALGRLDERDRQVLLLREEGFKHREIAQMVGTTTGSIGTMVARSLEKLARELDRYEDLA